LAGLLKRSFSRDRLCLPVVELAFRVDVQPAPHVGVLVALDLAGLSFPLVIRRFIRQGCLDWSIVTMLDVGASADIVGCVDNRFSKNLAT
jgi:hypothetical protein